VIILDKGQTYSARAATYEAASHLGGSYVSSTKPIAITYKDDSMVVSWCADINGDQILPVPKLVNEYVALRAGNSTDDVVCITSTTNNNGVSIYNTSGLVESIVLNSAENYCDSIPISDDVVYIESDEPVIVLHLTGFSCEKGGAVLPGALSPCNGSSEVAFTRSCDSTFMLMVVTEDAAKNSFLLNGIAPPWNTNSFLPVPNTDLVYGRFKFYG